MTEEEGKRRDRNIWWGSLKLETRKILNRVDISKKNKIGCEILCLLCEYKNDYPEKCRQKIMEAINGAE